MRRIIFVTAILMANVLSMSAAKKSVVNRIDPTDWYVGMKNPQVQLMVYGQGIRDVASVTTDYPGVTIDSLVRLDSPNYLLVYLNLRDAQPGTMILNFGKTKVPYQLKAREKKGEERMGFTNADVLYMLMPDRFAQGANHPKQIKGMRTYVEDRSKPSLRHGGDLNGIREHLDYFNELGVTALWFTPVLENDSPDTDNGFSTYHGYATTDYYKVDPRFGTNEDYKRLCDEAHAKGLKIVMDMIFNHSGFEHPWTKDMPSNDWLNTPEWLNEDASGRDPMTGFTANADGSEPAKSKYLQTRMDTYPYAYDDAMAQWMKELNDEYPNFNTVGETWVTEPAYTATWQKDSKLAKTNSYLKTVMDFSFFDKLTQAKNEETDGFWLGLNRLYYSFVYDYLYPNPSSVMAFIENHDTDRFLGNGCDTLALKQALALLLTVNRIPQLYYGTEVKDFPGGFPGDTHNAFTKENRTKAEQSMFQWTSRLLHWRQGNEVITKGSQTQFMPNNGIYVIARQYQGKTVLTILNGTSNPATMDVERYAEVIGNTVKAKDILTGRYYDLSKNVELKPRQSLILEY